MADRKYTAIDSTVQKIVDPRKVKVYLTISLLLVGVVLGSVAAALTTDSVQAHSNGIIIDFEDYNVSWFGYDTNSCNDPLELLKKACESKSYSYNVKDGVVTEINGRSNDMIRTWGLWYIEKSDTEWKKSDSYNICVKDYSAVAWAFRGSGEKPTVAVDSTGVCVYGYTQATKVVTLSPVASETMGSLKATSLIVGTDYYSNYPTSLQNAKDIGKVTVVGTYTDPSYELIMKKNPDVVIADGSQYNQVQISKSVRDANVNAIVLYEGEDIKTIYNNTYLVGVAIGYELTAKEVIINDSKGLKEVNTKCSSIMGEKKRIMVALSPDASPYVAGDHTYVNDILGEISAENTFASMNGWAHANTETIAAQNPELIIIITESYQPTQEEWDTLYNNLSDTWKSTDAYKNKEIYLICGKAVDLASRSSPRFPQLAELLGEMIYPSSFGMSEMPKYIGDEYTIYLKITKYLGYDN